jgi:hypothetical protein
MDTERFNKRALMGINMPFVMKGIDRGGIDTELSETTLNLF